MTSSDATTRATRWATAAILIAAYAIYTAMCAYGVIYGRTWIDEITYVIKSWWYVTGAEKPYSDADATWYMPLYFYQLGWAQEIFGRGHITGRVMSAILGAGAGGLVFVICRRMALAAPVAALGTALFLLTPTTAYYFTTATPIATVAFLLLLAVYLVQRASEAQPLALSLGLGVLFGVLYFYRQNMILALVVLGPLYLWHIGKRWPWHAVLVLLGMALVAVPILTVFPAKLALYAIRLPLVTPVLHRIGLLPDTLRLIQEATESRYTLDINLAGLSWRDPLNAFLLPFLGTNLLALAVFALYRSERLLMLVPAFYFFLAAAHYLGSAGYCPACILTYTSYFIGIGALAAALAIDALLRARGPLIPAALGIAALAFNALGPALAAKDAAGAPSLWRNFPLPLLQPNNGQPDIVETERLAGFVGMAVPAARRVLVLDDQPQLAYAVARSGRTLPVQGFNLRQSYRRLRANLSEAEKAEVTRILEAESLWTDATLVSWLGDPAIGAVMLQPNAVTLSPEARQRLDKKFRLSANIVVLGRTVGIYLPAPPAVISDPEATPPPGAGAAVPTPPSGSP